MTHLILVFIPVFLHMIGSMAGSLLGEMLGRGQDSTFCTTVTSLLVIPVAWWMYRSDRRRMAVCGKADPLKESGRTEACLKNRVLFGVFCFAGGGVLNIAWSTILNLLKITGSFSNETQQALLAGQAVLQILGLGILVPLAEELVFRGLMYGRMKRLMPVKLAALLSALLFALYHGNPIQIIFAFPMALVLTAVYEHGKLFVFPILFHMGANLTAVLLNFFL